MCDDHGPLNNRATVTCTQAETAFSWGSLVDPFPLSESQMSKGETQWGCYKSETEPVSTLHPSTHCLS